MSLANPTTNLVLERQVASTNSNTWGDRANANFSRIDQSISGSVAVAVTVADVTLTTTDTGDLNADAQSRYFNLELSGALTGNRNVIVPATNRLYRVNNSCSGAFTVTLKTSGGTGVAVPQGGALMLWCDATNVVEHQTPTSAAVTKVFWGGTSGGSANAQTVTLSPVPTAYGTGMPVRFIAGFTNTSTTPTLNANSLGAKTLVRSDNSVLQPGDIPAGATIDVSYDGTSMRLVSMVTPVMAASRGVLFGLTTSNNAGTPNTKVDIAAGFAAADTSPYPIVTLSGTATVDFGTNGAVNALDAGAIAASTTYHIFLISNGTTVGGLASTSASSPTMPSGYTLKRRIGSVNTNGSSQIRAYTQLGDEFLYMVPVANVSVTSQPNTAVTRTISTPSGIQTTALIMVSINNTVTNNALYISSLDTTDTAASSATGVSSIQANDPGGVAIFNSGEFAIRTNTSSGIRTRYLNASGASDTLLIQAKGWIDTRGRLS